jgi:2-keto-4-pentenoate hydratase
LTSRIAETAARFAALRRSGRPVTGYPGTVPESFDDAYVVQDAVLALYPGALAGWKVALVRPELRERFGAERYVGPMLSRNIREAAAGAAEIPVYGAGNTAVEAEFAFRLTRDLAPGETDFADALGPMFLAIEIIGGPISDLATFGPAAAISDHGNNTGFVFGRAITDWRTRPLEDHATRVEVNGVTVGEGSAANVPGGPTAAVAFLAAVLARRGLGLKAGDWISTGATTGAHRADPGDEVVASFGSFGSIALKLTKAGVDV